MRKFKQNRKQSRIAATIDYKGKTVESLIGISTNKVIVYTSFPDEYDVLLSGDDNDVVVISGKSSRLADMVHECFDARENNDTAFLRVSNKIVVFN